MSLQERLFDLDDLHSFSDLSTFTQNIPIEWVESALHLADKATIRRRRLPSDQVLWLVLGMALSLLMGIPKIRLKAYDLSGIGRTAVFAMAMGFAAGGLGAAAAAR